MKCLRFYTFQRPSSDYKVTKSNGNEPELAQIAGKFRSSNRRVCLGRAQSLSRRTKSKIEFEFEFDLVPRRKLLKAFREIQMGQSHAQGQQTLAFGFCPPEEGACINVSKTLTSAAANCRTYGVKHGNCMSIPNTRGL